MLSIALIYIFKHEYLEGSLQYGHLEKKKNKWKKQNKQKTLADFIQIL